MDSCYEVVSHGFGLPQLVGVTIVHHVITAGKRQTINMTYKKNIPLKLILILQKWTSIITQQIRQS